MSSQKSIIINFFPEQGFGFSCEGEEVTKVYNGDTAVIKGGEVHPQVAGTWLRDVLYLGDSAYTQKMGIGQGVFRKRCVAA